MTPIRLYIDEDAADGDLRRSLCARGFDVVSAFREGMSGKSDDAHLKFATSQNRVIYSFNVRDFHRIHAEWIAAGRTHAGIILAQQKRYAVGDQVRRLSHIIGSISAESMRSRLEFLSHW